MDHENPNISQILDLIQRSMTDWSSYKLRTFPQFDYIYQEESHSWHDFFLSYLWNLDLRYIPQLGWNLN